MNLKHTYACYQYKQVIVFSKAGAPQSRPVELECDSKRICVLVIVLAIKNEYMVQSWWNLQIRLIFKDQKVDPSSRSQGQRSRLNMQFNNTLFNYEPWTGDWILIILIHMINRNESLYPVKLEHDSRVH